MYLETIIDIDPNLQIIYHCEQDRGATVLETSWSTLDAFCANYQPYEILLEHYDVAKEDISQTYHTTDLKTWIDQLPKPYKLALVQQFVSYCEHCQPSTSIYFFN